MGRIKFESIIQLFLRRRRRYKSTVIFELFDMESHQKPNCRQSEEARSSKFDEVNLKPLHEFRNLADLGGR